MVEVVDESILILGSLNLRVAFDGPLELVTFCHEKEDVGSAVISPKMSFNTVWGTA